MKIPLITPGYDTMSAADKRRAGCLWLALWSVFSIGLGSLIYFVGF